MAASSTEVSGLVLAVVVAVATLFGALVGGLVALYAEKRRQEFAREQEEARNARDDRRREALLMSAARGVDLELRHIASVVFASASTGWAPQAEIEYPKVGFTEPLKQIAEEVDDETWDLLVMAQKAMTLVEDALRSPRDADGEHLTEDSIHVLQFAYGQMSAAAQALRRYAQPTLPPIDTEFRPPAPTPEPPAPPGEEPESHGAEPAGSPSTPPQEP